MRILLCTFTILLFASSIIAQDRFDEIDTNKDGYISWEEFQVAMPKLTKVAFDAINTSKSGKISREEWNNFQSSHGGMMHMGGSMGIGDENKIDPAHVSKMPMHPNSKESKQQCCPELDGKNPHMYMEKPLVKPPSKK